MAIIIDETSLPDEMEQGAEFGPEFSTGLLTAGNAIEDANQNWSQARHKGTFNYGKMSVDDLMVIKRFQLARRGIARGFLFHDNIDDVMARQVIATGDGAIDRFPILKEYADAVNPYFRIITRPVISGMSVWVNNVLTTDFTFTSTGGILFDDPPGSGEEIEVELDLFNVPVRFTDDYMPFAITWIGAISVPAFGIIEVPEYTGE